MSVDTYPSQSSVPPAVAATPPAAGSLSGTSGSTAVPADAAGEHGHTRSGWRVERGSSVPGYFFAIKAPYNDGLPGEAVLGVFAYKPHADLAAEAPAMLAFLRDFVAGGPNDEDEQCVHCGRDNSGEDQTRCAYFGEGDPDNCRWENARAILARIDGEG